MGRTIPSFRIASAMKKEDWKPFHNALDKKDRKKFDEYLTYLNSTYQLALILFSMLGFIQY